MYRSVLWVILDGQDYQTTYQNYKKQVKPEELCLTSIK